MQNKKTKEKKKKKLNLNLQKKKKKRKVGDGRAIPVGQTTPRLAE
jgi:hypothetical protein